MNSTYVPIDWSMIDRYILAAGFASDNSLQNDIL
jgi:hypothetical protein